MRTPIATLLLAALSLAAACSTTDEAPPRDRLHPVVVLMTDFGTRDDAVALLRGVVLSIARDAQVLDLTHEVPPYDIEAGARALEDSPGLFPPGTVFIVVVDPGVGTERKPIAVELANGSFLVGPDNGVLSLAMAKHGVRSVRAVEDPRFVLGKLSTTFHGRDVFAPAGAHLATGSPPYAEIGPTLSTGWVRLPARGVEPLFTERAGLGFSVTGIQGEVVALDEPFGNVWTNVDPRDLAKLDGPGDARASGDRKNLRDAEHPVASGQRLVLELGEARTRVEVPLVRTFGDVPEGKPLAYWSSRGKLALAINLGDAARTYGVKRGARVIVSRSP